MTNLQRLQTIAKAELFKDINYKNLTNALKESYKNNDYKSFDYYSSKFPTEEQLFNTLCEKLEGKSVGTNIKRLLEGKVANKYSKAKVYSSLLTHSLIECEKGNTEYKILFEGLISKIIGLI